MKLKLQKFVPIDREFPIYEIIDAEGNVILDVSRSDNGTIELGLQPLGSGRVIPLKEVLHLIDEATTLLEREGSPTPS